MPLLISPCHLSSFSFFSDFGSERSSLTFSESQGGASPSCDPDGVFYCSEQKDGAGGGAAGGAEDPRTAPGLTARTAPSAGPGSGPGQGTLHLPSAAVCVGVLPGLCPYSGSSDSDSSSDSEGSVDAIMLPYPRHSRAYR